MNKTVEAAIRAHAEKEFPRESCGLVIVSRGRFKYVPCRNIAQGNSHFHLHPEDYASAEEKGEIHAIVHSHPNSPPTPSQADLIGCESTGIKWIIVNWPTGAIHTFEPSGYVAPLLGRKFVYGILDCYGLARDYYKQELKINLPDFARKDEWWLHGRNLVIDHMHEAGFEEVKNLQKNDLILMQIGSPVINHIAVYIGDEMVIQHCRGLLSSRDIYGGYWRNATVKIIRHRSQQNA